MATATKSAPKSKSTTAPATLPTDELNISAPAPASDATTAPPVASVPPPATDPAPPVAEATTATPEATALTLQEAIASESATAPVINADDVADAQRVIFKRIIGKAQRLANIENKTLISIGGDLQEAVDSFKTLIPKAD